MGISTAVPGMRRLRRIESHQPSSPAAGPPSHVSGDPIQRPPMAMPGMKRLRRLNSFWFAASRHQHPDESRIITQPGETIFQSTPPRQVILRKGIALFAEFRSGAEGLQAVICKEFSTHPSSSAGTCQGTACKESSTEPSSSACPGSGTVCKECSTEPSSSVCPGSGI